MNVQQKMATIVFTLMLASTFIAPTANSLIDYNVRKVLVENLDPNVDDVDLKEIFGKYGDVRDAFIIHSGINGRSKGSGIVTFADKAGADRAISEANGMVFKGRSMFVFRATKMQGRGAGGGDRTLHRRGSGFRPGSGGGYAGGGYGDDVYGGNGYGDARYGGGYDDVGYAGGFARRRYGGEYAGVFRHDRRSIGYGEGASRNYAGDRDGH